MYVHRQVNHSQFFRDPDTGVHTNNVEAYWSSIKHKLDMNAMLRTMTQSYLDEHLCRERVFRGDVDMVDLFLADFALFTQ